MSAEKKVEQPLHITPATTSDILLIQELTSKIWPQTYAAIISKDQIEYMMEMMYSEPSLIKQFTEGCNYILIHENEKAIGFASYQQQDATIYKLDKIYILKSQQGKGIGKLVIDYILDTIKNKGGGLLKLQVNRQNINAKLFYERIGFKVIDEANFDIGNGYFMNDYIMEKKI